MNASSGEPSPAQRSGTLMLHLLGRCNLRCQHCYMQGAPERQERLAVRAVLDAIAECASLGVGALYLTGGEPLLYPDLPLVLDAAAADPDLLITLCTNGTLLRPWHAALLEERGVRANISIDGLAPFHDAFRQRQGAFRRTERGVRLLVAHDVPVTIVTTVSRGNLAQVAAVADWAVQQGAAELRLQPLLTLGRGRDIAGQCLSGGELNELLLVISDLANRYRTAGFGCNLVGVSRRFLLAHPCGAYVCNGAGCHRRVAKEIKKLVVREDGTVLPEVTNLHPTFALGRLGEAPLSDLVSRYFADGYTRFDQLCRATYAAVLPNWDLAVVPWDQIVADRSYVWQPVIGDGHAAACASCPPVPAVVSVA